MLIMNFKHNMKIHAFESIAYEYYCLVCLVDLCWPQVFLVKYAYMPSKVAWESYHKVALSAPLFYTRALKVPPCVKILKLP